MDSTASNVAARVPNANHGRFHHTHVVCYAFAYACGRAFDSGFIYSFIFLLPNASFHPSLFRPLPFPPSLFPSQRRQTKTQAEQGHKDSPCSVRLLGVLSCESRGGGVFLFVCVCVCACVRACVCPSPHVFIHVCVFIASTVLPPGACVVHPVRTSGRHVSTRLLP